MNDWRSEEKGNRGREGGKERREKDKVAKLRGEERGGIRKGGEEGT